MSFTHGKIRVLIATTNGPVEVQLLTEEDAAIGRCVACIGGTTETADIASAYHAFVVRPTGIIEGRFGHSCYRLDVSGRIDAGSSWQLGVLAAHALLAAGRLAQENDTADAILWATGSVRPVDLTVGGVSHVPDKLANSFERIAPERAAGRAVLMAIPAANADDLPASVAKQYLDLGAEFVTVPHAQVLFDVLGMKLPGNPKGASAATAAASGVATPAQDATTAAPSRRKYAWAAATAAALIAVAAAGALTFGLIPPPAPEIPPKPEAARYELVPETIPMMSDLNRKRIRSEYMAARDHKALVITLFQIFFVSGLPSQDEADKAAMQDCEQKKRPPPNMKSRFAEVESRCNLFASGNFEVAERVAIPLPPTPWVNTAVRRPFAAAELPTDRAETKESVGRQYLAGKKSKALVTSRLTGFQWFVGLANPDEAIRRTLERCGYHGRAACQLIAVDDTFVVALPTSATVVGYYHQDSLFNVSPEERAEVARLLSEKNQGWSAVATGAKGRTGVKVEAASEAAAVEGAVAACSERDTDCRVAVIGPFLVQAPTANAAP